MPCQGLDLVCVITKRLLLSDFTVRPTPWSLERFCKFCGELASRLSVFHEVKPFPAAHDRPNRSNYEHVSGQPGSLGARFVFLGVRLVEQRDA